MSPRAAQRLGAALLAAVGLAVPAFAQDAADATPDVPAGSAVLRGRVVHPERPEAAGGVEVVLYALSRPGQPDMQAGVRRTETAPDGSFRFEAISGEPDVVYLVGASYRELPFLGERVTFAAGEGERTVEIEISDPSEDAGLVERRESSVRVEWLGDRLGIGEVHRLHNRGDRVFHVPTADRAGRSAPLHVALLPGAREFAMPFGVVPEGVVREGDDLYFWGPVYPGDQEISFRYEVPVQVGVNRLTKRFPSAVDRVRVFGREDGPLKEASGLEPVAVEEEEGTRFQPFEREAVPAGFATTLRLEVPETVADAGALRLVESQIVLEVDDVMLRAQEQHQIQLEGPASARAEPGELLLELPLPPGAEELRFSTDASHMGLVQTDAGIGLVGPVAPGRHGLGLAYTLRSGPDGVELQRRFDRHLPLLRVFVADTGVAVSSNRLHRRRPVRDADRTYLIFEAFEVEPEESIELSLRPLPPRVGSSAPALAVALLGGLAALGFLVSPLRGSGEGPEGAAAAPVPEADPEVPRARQDRERVYEAIRDLDHDYETGKLSEPDWHTLRDELRAEAVELLARERAGRPAPAEAAAGPGPPAPQAAPACPGCGAGTRAGDRFCAQCGQPLAEGAARA